MEKPKTLTDEILAKHKEVMMKYDAMTIDNQTYKASKKEYEEAQAEFNQFLSDVADEKKQPKLPGIARASECEGA